MNLMDISKNPYPNEVDSVDLSSDCGCNKEDTDDSELITALEDHLSYFKFLEDASEILSTEGFTPIAQYSFNMTDSHFRQVLGLPKRDIVSNERFGATESMYSLVLSIEEEKKSLLTRIWEFIVKIFQRIFSVGNEGKIDDLRKKIEKTFMNLKDRANNNKLVNSIKEPSDVFSPRVLGYFASKGSVDLYSVSDKEEEIFNNLKLILNYKTKILRAVEFTLEKMIGEPDANERSKLVDIAYKEYKNLADTLKTESGKLTDVEDANIITPYSDKCVFYYTEKDGGIEFGYTPDEWKLLFTKKEINIHKLPYIGPTLLEHLNAIEELRVKGDKVAEKTLATLEKVKEPGTHGALADDKDYIEDTKKIGFIATNYGKLMDQYKQFYHNYLESLTDFSNKLVAISKDLV